MGRDWPRDEYIQGTAEYGYAWFKFCRGELLEEHLIAAEQLARSSRHRQVIRALNRLRGHWYLNQGRWARAADCFREAIRMAHEVGRSAETSETQLALAKFHLGQLDNPRGEAQRLASAQDVDSNALAELWLAIGDTVQAQSHAIDAYKIAWSQGEPYVQRYALDRARSVLDQLQAKIPRFPPYDPSTEEKLPWEDELDAALEKLRAEKSQSKTEASQKDLQRAPTKLAESSNKGGQNKRRNRSTRSRPRRF